MNNSYWRLFVTLILCEALIYLPVLHAAQLSLPSGDLIAPEVTHEVITDNFQAGATLQIKATVTDNIGVKSVTLFFRTKGAEDYKRASMTQVGDTDEYAVTLGKNEIEVPGVDYYIQAMDLAGNSLLHGYSFSPLSVSVVPATVPSDSVAATEKAIPTEPEKEKKSSKKNWLWIGLGVLAAGAVVAALASGGDNGGDDGGGDTGTVVISAPNP